MRSRLVPIRLLTSVHLDGFLSFMWPSASARRSLRPSCRAWPRCPPACSCLRSPSSVARTTLYGLVEPWLLASMLVTPITSNTARIGPPAMMPVPSGAGCISTRAAPWLADHRVVQRAVLQRHLEHACGGPPPSPSAPRPALPRLALAHADAAVAVADHGERGEAEHTAALHHLGDAVDRDHLLAQAVAALVDCCILA